MQIIQWNHMRYELDSTCPNFGVAYRLYLTVLVTVGERSFSKLKLRSKHTYPKQYPKKDSLTQ
jgi:hypothetical protein